MAINFPNTPSINDTFTSAGITWTWDGTVWNITPTTIDLTNITLMTEVATTSGTAFDFIDIPAGVNEITMMFDGISLTGTDEFLVQIGDSGGIETTGYDSVSGLGGTSPQSSTVGFMISGIGAAEAISGMMVMKRMSGNKWVEHHELHRGGSLSSIQGSGIKTLSAELDRVRLTRTGANTFDAGLINVSYLI